MKTNHSYTEPNEANLRLVELDYVFNLIFYDFLKWHIEGDQNYSENSDEDENVKITSKEELKKSELPENKARNELVEKRDFIRTTNNRYELNKVNISQNIGIKYTKVYSKINGEEINLENSTDFDSSSSVLSEIKNFRGNKSKKSLAKKVTNEDLGNINYSVIRNESQNRLLVADSINFESLEGTREMNIDKQDSDYISSNINLNNKPNKGGNESVYIIQTQNNSSSTTVQQIKYKNSFKFHPNMYKLVLTNSHHSRSIPLRTLMPRTIVKRSLPSASSRQLETQEEGNFPVSIAGSSLYGTYAYAHTRPSGFGIFPTSGGEEGEDGEPTEGGENVGGDEGK